MLRGKKSLFVLGTVSPSVPFLHQRIETSFSGMFDLYGHSPIQFSSLPLNSLWPWIQDQVMCCPTKIASPTDYLYLTLKTYILSITYNYFCIFDNGWCSKLSKSQSPKIDRGINPLHLGWMEVCSGVCQKILSIEN
jgi:hypothetical protein